MNFEKFLVDAQAKNPKLQRNSDDKLQCKASLLVALLEQAYLKGRHDEANTPKSTFEKIFGKPF